MNSSALTEMVDRVFSDRYRIEELIGIGAISAVFSAYDPIEGRWVALKVFDSSLATDDRFVARLLDAVEQMSVLNHANVVEIYDWGVDSGPYIVSELCEGGSLAGLIEAGHILNASQALVLALEAARALNYGHEQGAIHRNLTPRNVLFTDDQRVRISDYGLSKVLAEAPILQSSRALENVRYASPEQARGRPVGESSDLYSLALVVSEAVSGQAPEVAETVIGTLMERAESPATLAPALDSLLPPLERCGRVDPDERPEAEELAIALLASAETMARPEALPVVGIAPPSSAESSTLRVAGGAVVSEPDRESPDFGAHEPNLDEPEVGVPANHAQDVATASGAEEDFDDDFDVSVLGPLDDTDAFATAEHAAVDHDEPVDSIELVDPSDVARPELTLVQDRDASLSAGGAGLDNLDVAEPAFVAVADEAETTDLDVPARALNRRATAPAYEEIEDDADDRLPWWPLVVLGLLIAAAIAAGVYFFGVADSTQTATVPDLIGVPFDDLDERIGDRGWMLERLEDRVDGSTTGAVISQSPSAGSELDEGGTLAVTISLGNEMVEIPSDIVGLTVDQAISRLDSVGLALGRVSEERSEALAAGLVLGFDEPTTQKPTGDGVDLRVSLGPEDRLVPASVVGLSIGDATSLLVGLRLQAVEELAYSPDVEVGIVITSIPAAGEIVPADSAVQLVVSAGPEPVEMPDIVGLQLDEAIDVIEELGLIFVDTTGTPGEEVIGALPPIGAVVDVGAEVTVILNDPEDDEESE